MRGLRDRANHATDCRIDQIAPERECPADHITAAEEPSGGSLAQKYAAWIAQGGARVARDKRKVEDIEKLGIHRHCYDACTAAIGSDRGLAAPDVRLGDGFKFGKFSTQVTFVE